MNALLGVAPLLLLVAAGLAVMVVDAFAKDRGELSLVSTASLFAAAAVAGALGAGVAAGDGAVVGGRVVVHGGVVVCRAVLRIRGVRRRAAIAVELMIEAVRWRGEPPDDQALAEESSAQVSAALGATAATAANAIRATRQFISAPENPRYRQRRPRRSVAGPRAG